MVSFVKWCCLIVLTQLKQSISEEEKCDTGAGDLSQGDVGRSLLQKAYHQTVTSSHASEIQIYTNASDEAPVSLVRGGQLLGERLVLSDEDKMALVSKHNYLRAAVHVPCTAADMETLQWDDELAAASQKYAEKCVWQHDPTNHQNHWGENLAMSWSSAGNSYDASSLEKMVQQWYDEIVDVDWVAGDSSIISKAYADPQNTCKAPAGSSCMIGHYTQVVWASTNKIGCGVASCTSGLAGKGGIYLVCKYNPPGNMRYGLGTMPPFMVGKPCASCSKCSEAVGVAGKLCAAGDVPTRCKDSITTMTFNGVSYKDCSSLVAGVPVFCLMYNQKFRICDLTCKTCTIASDVGPNFCSA